MTITPNERREFLTSMRERGPGPGKYMLPPTVGFEDHDFTKWRGPAYSLGLKLQGEGDMIAVRSPGPKYAPDPKMTIKGREEMPAYSMGHRYRPFDMQATPGPAAYSIGHIRLGPNAPAYTAAQRLPWTMAAGNPAPNAYTLPPSTGPESKVYAHKAPTWPIMSRHGSVFDGLIITPGPGAYSFNNDVNLKRPPHYSMIGRNYPPDSRMLVPGPGRYRNEDVYSTYPQGPAFSMGIRHSEYIIPLIIDVSDD